MSFSSARGFDTNSSWARRLKSLICLTSGFYVYLVRTADCVIAATSSGSNSSSSLKRRTRPPLPAPRRLKRRRTRVPERHSCRYRTGLLRAGSPLVLPRFVIPIVHSVVDVWQARISRKDARGEDAKEAKDWLPLYQNWTPALHGLPKTDRGFRHPQIRKLITPLYDQEKIEQDPQCVLVFLGRLRAAVVLTFSLSRLGFLRTTSTTDEACTRTYTCLSCTTIIASIPTRGKASFGVTFWSRYVDRILCSMYSPMRRSASLL